MTKIMIWTTRKLFDDEIPDFEEEFRVNPDQGDEPDDREIPDDDDGYGHPFGNDTFEQKGDCEVDRYRKNFTPSAG